MRVRRLLTNEKRKSTSGKTERRGFPFLETTGHLFPFAGWNQKRGFVILDDTVALHLYRIVPKALINANKPSRAREGIVSMNRNPDGTILLIAGDGMALSDSAAAGIGTRFHIMRYRARSIGAKSKIQNRRGGGTEIICVLPQE